MNIKVIVVFLISAALFTGAAAYRFYDSAHAIGTIKRGGGKARHPALLDANRDQYILIATASVIPPYRGNARVTLEGAPNLSATFHNSGPVVDLGIYRHPEFRDNTYYDLQPKDKIAVWVKIKREPNGISTKATVPATGRDGRAADPACSQCDSGGDNELQKQGKAHTGTSIHKQAGNDADNAQAATSGQPEQWRGKPYAGSIPDGKDTGTQPVKGPVVAFYDTATNERLLSIPIRFKGQGGDDNEH